MKKLGIWLLVVLALVTFSIDCIWYGWWYPKNYEYALRLADDSSLPQVKADYLKEYLGTVSTIKHKPAYVFMRRDMELDRQREILGGLIQRFEDVARILPSEMAYQQGMEQLTGQEMNHQLDRISSMFKSAKLRESGIFWISWLAILSIIALCIIGGIVLIIDNY